jgi:hypothetical protein
VTDEEIKKFQNRARYVAIIKGYDQLSDDFAQDVILRFLEGLSKHQTINQMFIDFIRVQFGRHGTPAGDAKSRALHTMLSIHDLDEDEGEGVEE